ncbi:sugar phosphate isomerase/epimerase family protein [Streptomyces albidoflavus]|uniref:sugar phosphate isomerase/epimerase family protein n=1 Tax=Streptomyces albidoflavus TaxID=1886 RepID=UPI001889F4AD|nr:sugar phosphate isomerase/epimerase [Streptomyces albidoflavus]MBF4133397.1 sugar phosphate isomerase/epimerase [Streptomyces albidoflavus]
MTAALPIGANPWIWYSPVTGRELAALLPRLAGWGFDCVELPLENPGDWKPAEAAALLGGTGLAPAAVIAVMPPGRELVRAGARTVQETQDYLRVCVDAAHALGAPAVAGPVYSSVGRTGRLDEAARAEAYRQWREHLWPVLEHARDAGVRIAVEPLNRYETSLFNTVAQTLEGIGDLPGELIGLALDTYHQNIEERSLPGAVRQARGRIAHVQVCAADRGSPGADALDWPGFLAELVAGGWGGPLCIESFTAHNASIAVAASVWRPLAESQDALAVDGLAFLRGALTTLP